MTYLACIDCDVNDTEENKFSPIQEIELSYYQLIKKIDQLDNFPEESTGMEGIINRIILGIVDLVIKLINNIKSIVIDIFKNIKRSELKAFSQSNLTKITILLKSDYTKMVSIEVPNFPFTNNKTEMIGLTKDYFNQIDILNRIKNINNTLMTVYANLNNNEISIKQEITTLHQLVINDTATEIFNLIKKTTRLNAKAFEKFGNMFTSTTDFKNYYKSVMELNGEFDKAISCTKILENKTYKILEKINDVFKTNPDIVSKIKKDGKQFVTELYNIGYMIDAYGHLIKNHEHAEHNLINIFKVLIRRYI